MDPKAKKAFAKLTSNLPSADELWLLVRIAVDAYSLPAQYDGLFVEGMKSRSIQHMMVTSFWHPDGTPMLAQQFMEMLFGKLPEFFKDEAELRDLWSVPDTRAKLMIGLAEKGFGSEQMAEMQRISLVQAHKINPEGRNSSSASYICGNGRIAVGITGCFLAIQGVVDNFSYGDHRRGDLSRNHGLHFRSFQHSTSLHRASTLPGRGAMVCSVQRSAGAAPPGRRAGYR